MRLVKGIEELGPELQLKLFSEREVFEGRDVPVLEPGPVKNASSGIAKPWMPGREISQEKVVREASRIKPVGYGALACGKVSVAGPVRPKTAGRHVRNVLAGLRCPVEAGL